VTYTTVISAESLSTHLDDPDWVIVDCRFTLSDTDVGRRAYEESHIPGARYAHLDDDLSSPITPTTGRHPLPDPAVLARRLGAWGIGNETQVVVYDDSFGGMAGRLWWLLRWLGHDRVALLDGGLPAWTRKKLPMTAALPEIATTTFVPHLRTELTVSADEVGAAAGSGSAVVLDARAEERFTGEVEPLDRVAGHVPGAVNLPYDDNLDLDGTMLPSDEMLALYRGKIGSHAGNEVIVMCGSGVTACHNLIALEIAGIEGARLYPGSWSEWIRDPSRPVATGEDS
jgi:thiosulfate/3-mercaptopyruvate sulfurtransferase